ncbi:sensor histidine kinase [Paenibacillus thermotolerans]|uniref:sensor histidine kinase n=1 Tax=Paenibacillus thermotolerans TaxID=3027807 RepID=UPI0023675266|nr:MULTISPECIES: HAMP domain-containing sensor histidine kinase [unclassified Paenibacillus]
MRLLDYKDLLLNVFIILIPLVFFQYTTMFKNKWFRILSWFVLYAVPMFLTMTFPINAEGTVFDFRSVPLTVGSLYGGVYGTIFLYVSLFVFRSFQGGIQMLYYFLALLPSLIIVCIISYKFLALRFRDKIFVSVLVCLLIRLLSLAYFVLTGKAAYAQQLLFDAIPLFVMQSILTAFCVYIIEAISKNLRLQAEVANAEKIRIVSDIAASVAHEVRNPLTAVRGFIQLLSDSRLSEEKRRQYSYICMEELDRAQTIISDYLSLAKPEHDDQIERFDVRAELQYITSILSSYANYQNVEIRNYVDQPILLEGNRSKFRQAIINFGKNSIEAMPSGGVLEFRSLVEERELRLSVSDNGIGMTDAQVARLGTPYYSTKEKGTGLGTMVSYNIIHNMNGKIEVKSAVGSGTTYIITFPLPQTCDGGIQRV